MSRARPYRRSATRRCWLWGLISFAAKPLRRRRPNRCRRHHLGNRVLADHGRHQERAEGRDAEAAGREGRRAEAGRGSPPRWSESRRSSTASTSAAPPPKPEPKPDQSRAQAPKPSRRPKEKAAEEKSRAEGRSDRRGAEEGRSEEARAEEAAEGQADAADRSPRPKPQPKFDADRIAALLDKREPQRHGRGRRHLKPHARARHRDRRSRAAVAERDRRLARAARAVAGIRRPVPPVPTGSVSRSRIRLRQDRCWPDRRRSKWPAPRRLFQAMVDSAMRAILHCQPFTMLRSRDYDTWKDIESTSIRATCSAAGSRQQLATETPACRMRKNADLPVVICWRAPALGAVAALAARPVKTRRRGRAAHRHHRRATSSRCRSRLPDFVGGAPGDADVARDVTQSSPPICSAPACSRRSIRPPSSRRSPTSTRCRVSPTGAPSTRRRWSPGRVTRQADGRLKAEFRLWDVFAGQQLAGQQYFTDARQLAPHRAHHLRRDLRAAHRREGLFRQPRRVRRRDRTARSAASSGWRSWTRTAPTCAISRAARTSCSRRASRPRPRRSPTCRSARATRACFCSTSRPASARSSAISPA